MSATRSALLRVAALGTVRILGIVILVRRWGQPARRPPQVITTGTSAAAQPCRASRSTARGSSS